jgi:hypothetical protein
LINAEIVCINIRFFAGEPGSSKTRHEKTSRQIGSGGMLGRNIAMAVCITCYALIANDTGAAATKNVATKNAAKNATDNPLDIRLERSKVVVVAGRQSLQSASTAKPGDVLLDVATYTNKSSRTLSGVEATLPVPINTELMMSTVTPSTARASVDGTNFFVMPLKRKVTQANGVEVEHAVAANEYRYLRWYPGEIGPKQSIAFSAQFKVAEDVAGANGVVVTLKK